MAGTRRVREDGACRPFASLASDRGSVLDEGDGAPESAGGPQSPGKAAALLAGKVTRPWLPHPRGQVFLRFL